MQILGLRVAQASTVHLDMNQVDASPVTLYDGPIESFLDDSMGILDPGTRLYGTVWTGGPLVVIRYFEARQPRSDIILQICAVARLGDGQMRKLPGSKPGMAIVEHGFAGVYIVDKFR
jgi:hypothetical protein